MNSWKVILATLVIFGAGVVTGGLLVGFVVHTNTNTNSNASTASPAPGVGVGVGVAANPLQRPQFPALTPWQLRNRDLVHRMELQLDLTAEQHDRIVKIIADGQERTKALWKPIAPQMNREMQLVHAQIRDELTPDQQKKFDELTRPRGPKNGGDSSPNRQGGQHRMTNLPSPEAPVGAPAPQ